MSNYNYNKHSSNSKRSGTRREFHLTEEMKELLPISRVLCKDQKMFLYNGKAKPTEVQYFANDPLKTVNRLKQVLIDSLECTEEIAGKWCMLLSDVWLESESSEDEYEDGQQEKKTFHYLHKYTDGTTLNEAILEHGY